MRSAVSRVIARSNKMAQRLALVHVEGNMVCKVRIIRGGNAAPTWDPVEHKLVMTEGDVIWGPETEDTNAGAARIRGVTGPVTMSLGDEPQYFQSTLITIPQRARQPETDDIVEVVVAPDPALIGRFYRVVDVQAGGQIPVGHVLQVVGIQPGRTWRPPQ